MIVLIGPKRNRSLWMIQLKMREKYNNHNLLFCVSELHSQNQFVAFHYSDSMYCVLLYAQKKCGATTGDHTIFHFVLKHRQHIYAIG